MIVRNKKYTISLILEILKKTEQLPVEIPTSKCPNKDSKCKLRHGEYVISKYDKKLDRFLIRSYSVHRDVFLESWFASVKVNEMFINCLVRKKFTIPKLLSIINITNTYRRKVISIRYTEQEYNKILRKSRMEKMKPYDYVRTKSLN